MPSPQSYVHRSGRTGRASAEGCSVALVTAADVSKYHALLKMLGKVRMDQRYDLLTPHPPIPFQNGRPSSFLIESHLIIVIA